MKLWTLCLTLATAFGLFSTATKAQDNGLKTVDAKGTLEESNGFQLKIKDKAGKELNVLVDPSSSTLRYTGTADAKMLSPGVMVRFTGSFDPKGNPQADLKEIEIFRPKVGVRMLPNEVMMQTPGIYPVEDKQNAPANPNTTDNKNANANAANAANGNAAKNSAAKSTAKDTKNTKGNSKRTNSKTNDGATGKSGGDILEYRIVGQVTGVQSKKIQINTGNKAIVVQLANNSKINVSMPDAEFAVKGDQVHVIGLSNAAQPDTVQAKIVNITGAKPLAPQELEKASKSNDKTLDSKKDGKSDKTDSKSIGKPTAKKQ